MRIREASTQDAEAIAAVHVAVWRTTYRGLIPDEFLENLSISSRKEMWTRALTRYREDNLIFVVEDSVPKVVGFVACGREREDNREYPGEIYAIYLDRRHQGKGWGRALFLRAARGLLETGMGAMMLWVLKENPTRGFYEALNGVPFAEKEIEIGGVVLAEIAYGWPSLENLIPE